MDWKGKSLSKFQARVKAFLEPFWRSDLVYEEFPVAGTKMSFDFYNETRDIVIEVSPNATHFEFNKFFHKNRAKFLSQIMRDDDKHKFCEMNGILLIEVIKEEDISTEFFAQNGAI